MTPKQNHQTTQTKKGKYNMKLTRYLVAILIGCIVLGRSVFGPGIATGGH